MDHNENIRLDLCRTPVRQATLLRLIAITKGLTIEEATIESVLPTAAIFRRVQVEGLAPIVNYLERALPLPTIYTGDPARDALLDSASLALLRQRMPLAKIAPLYDRSSKFLTNAPSPTLLDLATIATLHSTPTLPAWGARLIQTFLDWQAKRRPLSDLEFLDTAA